MTILTNVVPDTTVEDLFPILEKLQSEVSGLSTQISSLQIEDSITSLETAVVERLDYVIAFLFLLVCFELLRFVHRLTDWI